MTREPGAWCAAASKPWKRDEVIDAFNVAIMVGGHQGFKPCSALGAKKTEDDDGESSSASVREFDG